MSAHIDKMKKLISGTLLVELEDYDLEHTKVYGLFMMKIVIYLDKQFKTLENKNTEREDKRKLAVAV
jgi:hypothetical protein